MSTPYRCGTPVPKNAGTAMVAAGHTQSAGELGAVFPPHLSPAPDLHAATWVVLTSRSQREDRGRVAPGRRRPRTQETRLRVRQGASRRSDTTVARQPGPSNTLAKDVGKMLDSHAAATITLDQKLGRRARAQLAMLIAQFLLGMGVNLIGQPSETSGAAKVVTIAALAGHVAIAVGLVVGAIVTVRLAAAAGADLRRQSWIGLALVAITVATGVLTMTLRSNWWSYLMAVGFVALLVVYGNLYLRAKSR